MSAHTENLSVNVSQFLLLLCQSAQGTPVFKISCNVHMLSLYISIYLSISLHVPFSLIHLPFPSIHTTPPRFSNSSTVRRRPYRHRTQLRTPVFRALSSGLNFRAASRLRSVSSSLHGLNDACAGRRLVDLCF